MKSLNRLGVRPASLPLAADDILEFHAARLLLLMHICGTSGRIDGLTKMAKLDFFTRYPDFFEVARASVDKTAPPPPATDAVESSMIRHHYGPWDKRYYQVLGQLEAKGLITVSKHKKSYQIALSDLGRDKAKALAALPSFQGLVRRQRDVKKVFGSKSGTVLKDLIYRLFDEEVGKRTLGQVIRK
jgi:DNA-binding PadR family transcriptional regulator